MFKVVDLRCEYERNPLSVDTARPRFGWKLEADSQGAVQSAYHVQVARDADYTNLLWDSAEVTSGNSQFVEYAGKSLKPRTRHYVRVRATGGDGTQSPWSESAWFETSLLGEAWTAPFIAAPVDAPAVVPVPAQGAVPVHQPAYLRTEFDLSTPVDSARVYVTALGLYELWINGTRVGDALLTPGWTNYRKRLAYQTYDVATLLKPGKNVLGAILGDGWYAGDLAWLNLRSLYGPRTALSLSLKIRGASGRERTISTGDNWNAGTGPILYSQLYHGETYDARLEDEKWCAPGFRAVGWKEAERIPFDASIVVPQDGPLVRRQDLLPAKALIVTPKGEKVLDFGQNLSGWVSFKVRGKAGDKVVLRHAEVLDAQGNFYTENMRSARNTIEYILKGGAEERFEPHFTFQGFRYVRVDSYPGNIELGNFAAQVIHSDMEKTLDFSCSNELLNQLHHNIGWGWKGNAVDIPTDCPQRDERLGWTGDAQVFVGTASYLFGVAPFFRKWLRDLKSEQQPDGGIPFVIPDILTTISHLEPTFKESHSSTGWGDAAVVCPWTIYQRYGDTRLLADQYQSMKGWVEYIRGRAKDGLIWNTGFHFGDWVALDAKEGSYFGATPNDLTATAYYAYSTDLLSKSATVLGKKKEAAAYRKLHREIVAAFREEFVTPSGRLAARTQTGHVLALVLGLVPEKYRARAVADLAALLEENGGHLTTGFLGTPWICRALSENGRLDLAYALLLKDDFPSWLYQITKGATTVWEHWDGLKPDGTMWSANMNSFNHYAYGAVGEWMYRMIGGLAVDESGEPNSVGFRSVVFRPQPGGGITYSRIAYRSPYGTFSLEWRIEAGKLHVMATVPPNARARLVLPCAVADVFAPGTGAPTTTSTVIPAGIRFLQSPEGASALIGSGTYKLSCVFKG